jgi:hypothetical protein
LRDLGVSSIRLLSTARHRYVGPRRLWHRDHGRGPVVVLCPDRSLRLAAPL